MDIEKLKVEKESIFVKINNLEKRIFNLEAEQESIKTSQSVIVNKNASLEGKVITLSSDIEKLEKSPNFITSTNIQKVQEFSCKLCEHSFTSELELKQHLESIHPKL